jgi:predicted O-methyltransferase YrrM
MLKQAIRIILSKLGYQINKSNSKFPVLKSIDPVGIDILGNLAFQASCSEILPLTLLDTNRLANLWQLCCLSNPDGSILEVGTYKGGCALHLSNCCPERKVIVCDSFEGFETLDSKLDANFSATMFKDNNREAVEKLFLERQRKVEVIAGFFPASVKGKNIGPVSFVHLDVDLYKPTLETLCYISEELAIKHSIIVLDDYLRSAKGVDQAVYEFTRCKRDWVCFPMFPGQGLILHSSWFDTL